MATAVRRTLDWVRAFVARVRAFVFRLLDTVPVLRRTVDELVRVEVIDRSMVIGAQALLALVPLVVVLGAFLPDVTRAALERLEDVTGMAGVSGELAAQVSRPTTESVRTQTGLVGLVVVVLSATSFARAVMRGYERNWALPNIRGIRGRRRALGWLLGWLVAFEVMSLVQNWMQPHTGWAGSGIFRVVFISLAWWWTFRILLSGRVSWQALVVPAIVTGLGLAAYTAATSVVMGRYVRSSVAQFGMLGLVLAVAVWLVGFAGVLVVTAVIGRSLVEDPWLAAHAARVTRSAGVGRYGDRLLGRPGQQFDDEENERSDGQQDEGPRPGGVVGEDVDEHDHTGH
jgi:membrane protein